MTSGSGTDLRASIETAWTTCHRATVFLIERIPDALWAAAPPPGTRRSVRSIAVHLHNARARWVRTLGTDFGVAAPALIETRPERATRKQVAAALEKSHRAMLALIRLGFEHGGTIPASKRYVWRNLPLDVGHFLAYFATHEGHHRGQILVLGRVLGHRVPEEAVDGLWQFTRFSKAGGPRRAKSGATRTGKRA